jgi:hypothetical protein
MDYADLVRIQSVCKEWRDCVTNVKTRRPLLYKEPEPLGSRNPHFNQYTAEALALTTRYSSSIFSALEWYHSFYFAPKAAPPPMLEIETGKFRRYTDSVTMLINEIFAVYGNREDWRTWPKALQEVFCSTCREFHPNFHWDHLHPLLRFLEHSGFCYFTGYGAGLKFSFHTGWLYATGGSKSHYKRIVEISQLCQELKRSILTMEAYKLDHDMFVYPTCTHFIAVHDNLLMNYHTGVRQSVRNATASLSKMRSLLSCELPASCS